MSNISLSLGTNRVLDDVTLDIAAGEVHALVGQNGAGKSTLMKVLGGVYPNFSGEVHIDDQPVDLSTPRAALKSGIGVIYQELSLVNSMSVIDNVLLGYTTRGPWHRSGIKNTDLIDELIDRVPLLGTLPLETPVGSLSAGLQQRVEIVKALTRQAKVLVMDEPTARLSTSERTELGRLIRELSAAGTSIVYISHFLEEVFDLADRATVLRNGRVVAEGRTDEFTLTSLTKAMLNEELLSEASAPRTARPDDSPAVLEAVQVSYSTRLHNISVAVRPGEILGVAGLVGSGRTRLARILAGADQPTSGTLRMDGTAVTMRSPRSALKLGVVMLAEDRKTQGILGNRPAGDNMILMALETGLSRWGFVNVRKSKEMIAAEFRNLQVRPADPGLSGINFSGGNQQKLLLARALVTSPRVFIADQPTTGVDVGTKAQIHRLIRQASASGTAIVVITDDIDELLALSDRVAVMSAGRLVQTIDSAHADRDSLIAAIAGGGGRRDAGTAVNMSEH